MIVRYNAEAWMSEPTPLAPDEVRSLINAAARHVDARESNCAAHRQISPGALLRDPNGAAEPTTISDPTEAAAYAAPEVLAGAPPTVRADVFSLAGTAYALLTGHRPNRHGFATVRQFRSELSPMVDGALLQAMASAPELRYSTATAFANALSDALAEHSKPADAGEAPASSPPIPTSHSRAESAPSPVTPEPVAATPQELPSPTAVTPQPPSTVGPRRNLIPDAALALVFIAVVVLILVGYLWFITP